MFSSNKDNELPSRKTDRLVKADADSAAGDTSQKDEKSSFTMPRQATPKRKVDAKGPQGSPKGEGSTKDQQDKPAKDDSPAPEEPGRDDVGGAAGRALGSFMADMERSGYRG